MSRGYSEQDVKNAIQILLNKKQPTSCNGLTPDDIYPNLNHTQKERFVQLARDDGIGMNGSPSRQPIKITHLNSVIDVIMKSPQFNSIKEKYKKHKLYNKNASNEVNTFNLINFALNDSIVQLFMNN